MNNIAFTLITSDTPLSKRLSLDEHGKLVKQSAAELTRGTFEKKTIPSIEAFANELLRLGSNNALVFGMFEGQPSGRIVTKDAKPKNPGSFARCKEDVGWSMEPGIMFIDYDPEKGSKPMPKDDLVAAIREACPFLNNVRMIWRPSASSLIRNTKTGDEVRGVEGQHIYFAVSRAADIPRIGKIISERLWLAGYGRYDTSASGSALERTIVDGAVWQPERLDFEGGAICVTPLKQDTLTPVIIPGDCDMLRSDAVSPLTPVEQHDLKIRKEKAFAETKGIRDTTKNAYIEARAQEIADNPTDPASLEKARNTVREAVEGCLLFGDFVLISKDGEKVRVSELLDNPKKWHNARFHDPLEPEYGGNDSRIAWANLFSGGRPYVFSHAHGGRKFTLVRAVKVIKLLPGATHLVVDQTLEVLRADGDLFDSADSIIRIVDGEMLPVSKEWLLDRLGRVIQYERFDKRSGHNVPTDPPNAVASRILAKRGERGFKTIKAVATAPTMTPSGRLIGSPGMDDETGILLLADEPWPEIPMLPTSDQVRKAYELIWKPFEKFPFPAGEKAKHESVLLAAILTAAVRSCLKTAPGFGFDAPTAGSGKTLLARSLGILATGKEPDVSPAPEDEAEFRKRIFTQLLRGAGSVLIDNLTGALDSAALAAVMTAEELTDRILGTMTSATVANRALWLLSGNNLRLVGDLNRRFMIARIDPAMEASEVYQRTFDLDPADYCRRHRIEMIAAALTIFRGYIAAGRPNVVKGSFASFDDWSATVRQTVAWIGQIGLAPVTDPLEILKLQCDQDPEQNKLESLLAEWETAFGNAPVTASTAMSEADSGNRNELKHVIAEISGGIGDKCVRLFSRWIEKHSGKIVGGRSFERDPRKTGGLKWWTVRRHHQRAEQKEPEKEGQPTQQKLDKLDKLDDSYLSPGRSSCQFSIGKGNYPTNPTNPTPSRNSAVPFSPPIEVEEDGDDYI